MKDDYTPDQVEEIVRLASKYHTSTEHVRRMLDDYHTSNFDNALDDVRDSLHLRQEEMIAEAAMDEPLEEQNENDDWGY